MRRISPDFTPSDDKDAVVEVGDGAKMEGGFLTVEEYDGLFMSGYFRISKGIEFNAHRHPSWLTITILEGSVRVKLAGQEKPEIIRAGETYLVEPDDVHTETMLEDVLLFINMNKPERPDIHDIYTVDLSNYE